MIVHIGTASGRIALWLTHDEALDLANQFPSPDLAYAELTEAAKRAYPERYQDTNEDDEP